MRPEHADVSEAEKCTSMKSNYNLEVRTAKSSVGVNARATAMKSHSAPPLVTRLLASDSPAVHVQDILASL